MGVGIRVTALSTAIGGEMLAGQCVDNLDGADLPAQVGEAPGEGAKSSRPHDVSILALVCGAQLAWIVALGYWLYWLAS